MNKLLTPHHTCGPPKAFPAVTLGTLAILLKTKSMSPPPYSLCHLLLGQTRPSLPLPKPFVPTSRPWPTLSLCLALLGLPVYPTGFAYRTPPHSLQPGSISKVNPSRCDWPGPEVTVLCAWLHSALFLPSKATTTASAAHRLERPPVAAPLLSWHCSLVPAAL